MEQTKIEWCDHTFNPWVGCSAISAGCANCYARRLTHRWCGVFDERRMTGEENWAKVRRWNSAAARNNKRTLVFCGSMCDWLDGEVSTGWLSSLLRLISETPALTWLLLTKRPENWAERMSAIRTMNPLARSWLEGEAPQNVWMGVTAENRETWNTRVSLLRGIPARVRWVSAEPLLEDLKLDKPNKLYRIDWVIAGGEKGAGSRPCDQQWVRAASIACLWHGVPFFFKQWGDRSTGIIPNAIMDMIEVCKEWPEPKMEK